LKPNINISRSYTGTLTRYCLWALLMASLLLSSCVKRTITTRKRSYSISGSGGEPDDSDKLKKRFASGFKTDKDGNMQTEKKDLYTDKSFRNTRGNDYTAKAFRFGKKDFESKEFKTLEYLNRQQDYRTKESNISRAARESDVDRFTTIDGSEEAWIKKNKPGFLDWLNPFSNNKKFQGAEKTYRTSGNRKGSKAVSSASVPVPMSEIGASPQDQRNPALSMDDVKKLINPAAYRKQN